MIVKNEEKFIISCLNRLFDIADEVVIVDTGSTDSTHKLIENWITKNKISHVVKFVKVGNKFNDEEDNFDFGSARSYSFSLATTTHIMWLDASDIIENPKQVKDIFKKVTSQNPNVYFTLNTRVSKQTTFIRTRITPKIGSKAIGKIHEYLDRNLKILLKEWETDKTRRNAFYLGNTYYGLKDYDNAFKFFKYRAYEFTDPEIFREEQYKAMEMVSFILLKKASKDYKLYEELSKISDDMIKFYPSRFEGYFYKSKCLMYKKEWDQAIRYLKMHMKCKKPKKNILWLDKNIYDKRKFIMDIEKCETAIKYSKILVPDAIYDYLPSGNYGNTKSSYKTGNNQYF